MAILTSSMWDPYKFKELEMVHKSSVVSTQCFLFTQKHPVPVVPSTMPEHSHTPHAQRCFSTPSSSHVHPNTENRFAPVATALSAGGGGEGCFNATQQYLPWFCYRDAQGFLEKLSGLPESSTRPSQLKAAPVLGSSTPAFAEEQPRLYRKMTRAQHCGSDSIGKTVLFRGSALCKSCDASRHRQGTTTYTVMASHSSLALLLSTARR